MSKLNQHPLLQLLGVVFHLIQCLNPQAFLLEAFTATSIFCKIQAFSIAFEPVTNGIAIAVSSGHGGIADEKDAMFELAIGCRLCLRP